MWVIWDHVNPVTGSNGRAGENKWYYREAELDPMGVNIGFEDPFFLPIPPPDSEAEAGIPALLPGAGETGRKCSLDGIIVDCGFVAPLLESGAAIAAPEKTIKPIWDGKKYVGFAFWNGQPPNKSGDYEFTYSFFYPDGGFHPETGEPTLGYAVGSAFMRAGQVSATFGSLKPNYGVWVTNTGLRTKLNDAFKAIQTEDCRQYVDSIIQKMGSHRFHTNIKANFEDLLKTVKFSLYNPGESLSVRARTWDPGGNGYEQLEADLLLSAAGTMDEVKARFPANKALTLDKSIYINASNFGESGINAGVLIVHEILHAAGIRTQPERTVLMRTAGTFPVMVTIPAFDPITGLESKIKEHCAPKLPGN
jgi:hypothetical protein